MIVNQEKNFQVILKQKIFSLDFLDTKIILSKKKITTKLRIFKSEKYFNKKKFKSLIRKILTRKTLNRVQRENFNEKNQKL